MNRGHLFLATLTIGLGAFYYFHDVKGKPQREEAEKQSKRFFPDLKKEQLVSLEIEQLKDVGKSKPYKRQFSKKHGMWVLDDPKEPHLLTNMLVFQATNSLVNLQRADDLGASATPGLVLKPADYGLEKPNYHIELKSSDGHSYSLNLGDKTPEGNGFYAQTPGGPIVSISTTMPEILETPEDKLRESSPVPYQISKVTKLSMTLEDGKRISVEVAKPREKGKDDPELEPNMEMTDLNEQWKMTSPEECPADAQKIRDLINTWKAVKIGRFLKPEEKIDFSKPYLRFEATVEGESEPYVFEVGPTVPAKPTMRYLRRLNPDETMVFEINNPQLLDITAASLEQRHLTSFEPDFVKRIDAKIKDTVIAGKKGEPDWTLTQPQPNNPSASSRDAAVSDLLFEVKNMEWKSKSTESAFTESASFQFFDKDDKPIVKLSLGQESGKGRLVKVEIEGPPPATPAATPAPSPTGQVYVIEPDPMVKLESIVAHIKQDIAPTPHPAGMPGGPGQVPIMIQNGQPVMPAASSTPVTITIPSPKPSAAAASPAPKSK